MSDTDKVAVQYEVDREDVERLIRIQEQGFEEIWEIVDDLLRVAETVDRRGGRIGRNEIVRDTRLEDMTDKFSEWEHASTPTKMGELQKMDIFAYIGLLEKDGSSYELALNAGDGAEENNRE